MEGADFVRDRWTSMLAVAGGRPVVVHEAWWPTGGDAAASDAKQLHFFERLIETTVPFVWGEAYDQFWKVDEGPHGPYWGLYDDRRRPKTVVAVGR